MIGPVKLSNRAMLLGGLLTLGMSLIFLELDLIFIASEAMVRPPFFIFINVLSIGFFWLFFSFLVSKISVFKIIFVLALLVIAAITDRHLPINQNPITIPFLGLFWLGVCYLIIPQFFRKYRFIILAVYGIMTCYYFYNFLATPEYGLEDRARFSNFSLLPIAALAALWGYEQWRWFKTLQADKTHAELSLLKSQINPHFFFNTLNNLYGLVVEKSDQAPEVILKLSDMMRYIIYKGNQDWVNLDEEIAYLKSYIELHEIRHKKNVDIQFFHDAEGSIKVAPLLYIILLENAFKHGVEKSRGQIYIHIKLFTEEDQIKFTIENNFVDSANENAKGIGLQNLTSRLNYLYPDCHELTIDSSESIFRAQLNLKII